MIFAMQRVVAGVIRRNGLILVAQRDFGSLAGKWEFPGGKVEESETPESALKREIQEEFNVGIQVDHLLGEIPFKVDQKEYLLLAFYATHLEGEYQLSDHLRIEWVQPSRLGEIDLAPADIPIAQKIIQGGVEGELEG